MAAELLFHHELPLLIAALDDSENPVQVAGDLHRAIWRHFRPGAIAYVEVLCDWLSSAHLESHQRISRDIHDRIGPALAIVRQRIELSFRDRPDSGLEETSSTLGTVLREVQSLTFDLCESVGEVGVEGAVRSYITRTPGTPPALFERHGTERPVSATVAEEAFAVLIECIRIVRRHAREATVIRVEIARRDEALLLIVGDGGADSAEGSSGTMLGLQGVRERAIAIGTDLDLERSADGSTDTLRVPYLLPMRDPA